ncbi:MAG TPA: lamin tail domain-containing protein [Halalkalibaculum sp.]|nr:lamin tail domain-containing protein [Halalkalibaculum sp.]
MKRLPFLLIDRLPADMIPATMCFVLIQVLFQLYGSFALAQTLIFEDGFSDGNFTENPVWNGDTTYFTIAEIAGNFQLQLQGDRDNGGISYLSAPSTASVGDWEFYINFNGFSPSDGNRTDIILMSDIADFKGPINGYALRAGENGSEDVFRIVRYDNGTATSVVLSGTTNISSGGDYRVKVRRQADGTWTLFVADSYGVSPSPEGGSQVDNTHTSTGYFGLKVTYSATRYNRFFFDFKIDLPPFTVRNISPREFSVDLNFNRNYDPATVEVSDFYISPDLGIPSSLNFPSPSSIELKYDARISTNRYTLSVNDLADDNGENISPDAAFDFTVFERAAQNDVVINEFMYDPPIGLPEYVELKNRSGKYLNLMGWGIGDQTGIGNIAQDTLTFEPGALLVLSPDTAALFTEFGSRNYVHVSSGNFPSLNNGGDAIRILGENGILIDSLYYSQDWGGEDIALERRSGNAVSDKKSNWADSPHGIGTPGLPNLIEADRDPPVFNSLNVLHPNTLLLIFNEELDALTATDVSHYSISPAIEIQLISSISDTVLLYLAEDLQSLQSYRVSASGLRDIFGNAMSTQAREVKYIRFGDAKPGDIVINEILYDEIENGSPEFVELHNTTGKNFNLSAWLIGDASGSSGLPQGTNLLAGDYLVLTGNAGLANRLANSRYIPGFPSLNNSGDIVYLKNAGKTTVDSLNYSSEWGFISQGKSLERKDPSGASNDPSNWGPTISDKGHTAGLQNSVFRPDRIPPLMIFANRISNNLIAVQFDEFINLSDNVEFELSGSDLSVEDFSTSNADHIVLRMPSSKSRLSSEILQVRNLTDIVGNITGSQAIPIARKPGLGDLVINEIMYNPIGDAEDNLPDQAEYVELKNTRDYAISLEGIQLHDAADENGTVRRLIPVSSNYKWIPAGGLALIFADEEEAFKDSKIAGFFELPAENTLHLRIDRSSLSLGNEEDAIFIADSSGITIDSVFYTESWQNPNLMDTRGIALERISPFAPGNDATNWSSSTLIRGGTPGSENSIFQETTNLPETAGISFSPNPFSPDDDGSDDHLFINYKLDQPDYLLKVQVYDRYGRSVRELADGLPGSFEGSLIWDGRNDAGKSNRIGIYIVVFEALNSAAGRNRAFKKTVVLARRLQ